MDKIRKIIRFVKRLFPKTPKMKFIYAWYYKHGKINEKQALFESFHGKDVSDSSLAILQEFLKMPESKDFKIYFATNDKKRDQKFIDSIGLKVELVDIADFKYVKVLATSKYLINNSSFPAYFIRRDEQVYLQTWHGTPLKTLGKRMRFGIESMYNVQHNFLHANYIMFPNEFTRKVIMEDYNLEALYTGTVVMNGYPRNSIFMDHEKADQVTKKLGNEDYTTMAYMPTWRGQSNHDVNTSEYSREINQLLHYLDENLKDDQKLYVNFHPIVQKFVKLDNYEHIYPFPSGVDKYEFLNSVDALITDYSSVFFDYSITRKPIILYMYDYEEYMHDRGMYFDIKELPFRKIYDKEALRDCLVNETFREDSYENDMEYTEKYIQYDSIDAAKNMAELVFHGNMCDMPTINYSFNKEKKRRVLHYPNVKTAQTIDTIAQIAKKDEDVVIFEKRFFNPELSSHLHDNYLDDFDYIFITRTLPRTYAEEVLKRKSAKVRKELHKREIKRCFADLPVYSKFETEYYHGEAGETFSFNKKKMINASMRVMEDHLEIKFEEGKKGQPKKLLFVNKKNQIIYTRNLTEKEWKDHCIKEYFDEFLSLEIADMNGRYQLMIELEDENGNKLPYFFVDRKEYAKRKEAMDELDKSSVYMTGIKKQDITYQNTFEPADTSVIPYMNEVDGRFSVFMGDQAQLSVRNMRGQVLKFKIKGSKVHVRMKYKNKEAGIKNVILSYRSKVETIDYPFEYKVTRSGDHYIIDAQIDMSVLSLEELFWDVFAVTEKNGEEVRVSAYWSRWQRLKLLLMNYQCDVDKEHIIFPYSTITCKMAFTYRTRSKYDGFDVKIKELAAFGVYTLLLPYWKKKRVWLVFEKFCSMAQDNGYYFFKYCMEQLPKEKKQHIYYILDTDSADYDKMKQYGKHVIPFMSFRHILYSLVANLYIASDSKKHLYTWRAKPNVISNRISKHNILFLQHGVTALKRVHPIFGMKGSSPMTHFTTTSRFEHKIIVENFGYEDGDAPILGFTRWDVLEDTSKPEEKIILAMPTWRSWLEEKSAEEFKASDYYKNYMKLLQNQKLARILKENDVKLIFYIHPKFKDYLSEFNVSGDNIELIPFGTEPLNEIMKKCSMLITDYSSVCWDVCYLDKPVLFYQFDYDMYMQAHGSYLDMEHELFGERYTEYEKLIDGIEEYIHNGFKEKEEYTKLKDYYFEYRDNDNSKRTYEYIISKGY